jgi:acetoin utilization deacetylase AcuC-like enzyme
MHIHVHHYLHHSWDEAPQDVKKMLSLVLTKLEILMTDVTKLQAIAARLQSSDTAALAALQALKDQNTALAAQLAAIQTGDPATQAAIDAVVTALTSTADAVDAAVTANPATPNLKPSP